jgi:hypothetical protein
MFSGNDLVSPVDASLVDLWSAKGGKRLHKSENPCVAGSIPVPANKFRRNFCPESKP